MRCWRAAAVSIAPVSRCRFNFSARQRAQYGGMARLIALALFDSSALRLDWLRSVIVCGCALALIVADRALLTLSL